MNDHVGHVAGDRVLIEVAHRLVALAGDSMTVGRTGGDEFVAVGYSRNEVEAFADAVRAAAEVDGGLSPGTPTPVGASVGVAHSQLDDTTTSLLARADAAMYAVKRSNHRSSR